MRPAYLVYNPYSGRYPANMMVEKASQILRDYGWDLRLEQAQGGAHITQLARQAAQEGADAFFISGGDGSINLAVAGLVGSETALGVLPAGTANVWAQEIGMPALSWTHWTALEESAHLLAVSEIHAVDVGLVNGKPFLLWAGVGLDAYIVHRLEPRERWEKYFAALQYTAEAAWNASFWRGINLRVEIDGSQLSGHYLLAVVSNIHLYAGGYAQISPEARLDDGLMDLWLFEGDDLVDTVQMAFDLISGRHLHSDQVLRHQVRTLALESDTRLYFQVDGEPVQEEGRLEIEVQHKALRTFIPPQTPHPLLSSGE
jgi:diacylglycerol kinase (ATP)